MTQSCVFLWNMNVSFDFEEISKKKILKIKKLLTRLNGSFISKTTRCSFSVDTASPRLTGNLVPANRTMIYNLILLSVRLIILTGHIGTKNSSESKLYFESICSGRILFLKVKKTSCIGVSGRYRAIIGCNTSDTGLCIFERIPIDRFMWTISRRKVTRSSPRICRPDKHEESFSRDNDVSWLLPSFSNNQSMHPE